MNRADRRRAARRRSGDEPFEIDLGVFFTRIEGDGCPTCDHFGIDLGESS